MANLLEQGSRWLSQQMKSHAGSEVTYRRGAVSVTLTAVIGRTDFEVIEQETASLVRALSRDYLIDAVDLVLASAQVLPERGDTIEEVSQDNKRRTYEVASPAPRTAHYKWSDPHHEKLRIHTKLVKVEDVEP